MSDEEEDIVTTIKLITLDHKTSKTKSQHGYL